MSISIIFVFHLHIQLIKPLSWVNFAFIRCSMLYIYQYGSYVVACHIFTNMGQFPFRIIDIGFFF